MTPEQLAAIERLRELNYFTEDSDEYERGRWETLQSAMPLIETLVAENERLKGGIEKAIEKFEASDLIDLAHVMVNDRYGAAKACIQKGLRELEALHDA